MVSLSIRRTQVEVPVQPPDQPPNVEGATGVAVRVTVVPTGKLSTQLIAVVAQLKVGLVTVPVPLPRKLTVRIGAAPPPPPPLVSVKQTTLAVMEPVTTAPEEDTPDPSAFVVSVAEIRVFGPQTTPVTVISPVELTVTSWLSLDAQVTLSVISLVTGGWRYEPNAVSWVVSPASSGTGILDAPKVTDPG